MTIHKVYVRGHGGDKPQVLPPSEELPIELITLGQYGCTMSGLVADTIIYEHWGVEQIERANQEQRLIYWTHAARNDWHERQVQPLYEAPRLDRHPYRTLYYNLVLQGAGDLGECGVCYWNVLKGELTWIAQLADREALLLSEILRQLREFVSGSDSIQLYWTACLDAEHWQGSKKAVSFTPMMK